jgi:hypothetical protein
MKSLFLFKKSAGGSGLENQYIKIVDSDTPPGFSQGYGLTQKICTSSTFDDRKYWALKALAFGVDLFCEPVGVALDLIDFAGAFLPSEGVDYRNAGSTDSLAYSWWNNGYDFGDANPVRQYCFNSIQWMQDRLNPSLYYGIKVWARVLLGGRASYSFDQGYYDTPPVYLEINRVSNGGGGCPYVYAWDGQRYVMDNNVLPASEISNGADVEDYYRLEQLLVPTYQGARRSVYSLRIKEFEHEHDYFDQVKLLAVDHPPSVNVAVSPYGEILTYSNPAPAIFAVDDNGVDVLSLLSSVDGDYYEGYNGSYIILNFGNVNSENAKLVLRTDRPPLKMSIHIQVQDSEGNWTDIATIIPRTYWATDIIDISSYLPSSNTELKVRLYFTASHKIDYIGLDTTPQASIEIRQAKLISAFHSTQGNVKPLLLENDQNYAELIPSEQIQLTFRLPNNQNQERTFILYTEGHYNTIQ